MAEFHNVIQYFITLAGIAIIFNSLIFLLILASIRPTNRKKDLVFLGLFQLITEFVVGLWLIFIKPIFANIDISFVIGVIVLIAIVISLFLRLYLFASIRALYSKE